jgi:hypothetical protein
MNCPYCDTNHLHTSRFRVRDLSYLLRLRYPVRCHRCRERMHLPIWFVPFLRPARRNRHRHSTVSPR